MAEDDRRDEEQEPTGEESSPEEPQAESSEAGSQEETSSPEAAERARAEAEATADSGEEPAPTREPTIELPQEARIQSTGKRKSSIARVVLRAGSGSFEINRRGVEDYFPRHQHQIFVRQPLV